MMFIINYPRNRITKTTKNGIDGTFIVEDRRQDLTL